MNYSIILNRHAGNGNAEKAWSSIKPVLDQQQIDYHMETTKYPNHGEYLASQIAQSHNAGSTIVIAIGGDGTLHQVVLQIQYCSQCCVQPLKVLQLLNQLQYTMIEYFHELGVLSYQLGSIL